MTTEQPNDDHRKYDSTHRLQLTFDKQPKDPYQRVLFWYRLEDL